MKKAGGLLSDKWFVLADISEYGMQKEEVRAVHGHLMRYATENGMVKAADVISRLLNTIQIEKLAIKNREFLCIRFLPQKMMLKNGYSNRMRGGRPLVSYIIDEI